MSSASRPVHGDTIAGFLPAGKGSDFLVAAVVAGVGFGGFVLGRLSGDAPLAPVVIETPSATADFAAAALAAGAPDPVAPAPLLGGAGTSAVIASKNGETYYPPGCSGASRIKEENKVSFVSAAAAEKAGYRKAKACK